MTRKLCDESQYPAPLLAVAAFGLSSSHQFPSECLPDRSWAAVLTSAKSNRVLGQLRAAVNAGEMPVTPTQRAELRAAHRAVLLRVLSLEQHLVSVHALLTTAGVECRVLKGSAYAHLDYPEPAHRSFIDLDLLFKPSDIATAVSTLELAGLTRTLAEPRPGFDKRFDKGTTLRSPAGFEIDLHRTFVLGPWGVRVNIESLWSSGSEFTIGDHTLTALSPENRFLHACYHASLGDWPLRLGSLRDVAQLSSSADMELVESWGVQAVVAAAVSDSTRLLGLPVEGPLRTWAAAYVPTRREEQWLGLHTRADKTFAAQAMATLPVLPGVRNKAAYLRALVLPDTNYTGTRHRSTLSRIRYGVKEALKGRGRTP